jgi:hypothetical protein
VKRYSIPAFLFSLLVLSLTACQSDAAAEIGPAIPVTDLVEILPEILLIDPAVREAPEEEQDSLARVYYGRVLEARGYTLDDFRQSMQWLQQDPKRLQSTYEQVLENATALETELRD